uniref:Pyruvate phosphate dikinase AMP/ATP-binding domain-containing protein n=1 Tax=Timema douglasi TaxID=61478 RepID=A0A7R8ZA89_TIMDO|nr:unnamed protein product [Timema douglasi]
MKTVSLFGLTPVCATVKAALATLLGTLDTSTSFAVRSSAVGEDSEDLSAAGQNATFLGVHWPEEVLQAVQECWGSLFTFQSVQYRSRSLTRSSLATSHYNQCVLFYILVARSLAPVWPPLITTNNNHNTLTDLARQLKTKKTNEDRKKGVENKIQLNGGVTLRSYSEPASQKGCEAQGTPPGPEGPYDNKSNRRLLRIRHLQNGVFRKQQQKP